MIKKNSTFFVRCFLFRLPAGGGGTVRGSREGDSPRDDTTSREEQDAKEEEEEELEKEEALLGQLEEAFASDRGGHQDRSKALETIQVC